MRRRPDFLYETILAQQGHVHVCGIDEVGRGAWAGPLVVAGVILPKGVKLPGLHDSKLISAKKREILAELIKKKCHTYHVVEISSEIIDTIHIQAAWKKAVEEIIAALQPDHLLIDGRAVTGLSKTSTAIIKGDAKVRSIAAASIIAKVHRDILMTQFAKKFPEYGFDLHKGYGTAFHQEQLKRHGICPIHRRSYQPISFLQ